MVRIRMEVQLYQRGQIFRKRWMTNTSISLQCSYNYGTKSRYVFVNNDGRDMNDERREMTGREGKGQKGRIVLRLSMSGHPSSIGK